MIVGRAIELLALALQHPAGTRRTRDRAGQVLAELSSGLPPDIVAAAQERGRQRDLWGTLGQDSNVKAHGNLPQAS